MQLIIITQLIVFQTLWLNWWSQIRFGFRKTPFSKLHSHLKWEKKIKIEIYEFWNVVDVLFKQISQSTAWYFESLKVELTLRFPFPHKTCIDIYQIVLWSFIGSALLCHFHFHIFCTFLWSPWTSSDIFRRIWIKLQSTALSMHCT